MTQKDAELLQVLISVSSSGKLKWEETAGETFTTSFQGKFNIAVTKETSGSGIAAVMYGVGETTAVFELRNLEDKVLLRVTSRESQFVDQLYEVARRSARNVDAAVDEVLGFLRGQQE